MSCRNYYGGKWRIVPLIIFNVVNLLIGIGVVGIGSWMIYDDLKISPLLGSHLFLIFSMLFVTCGGTVVIVSVLGIIAAIKFTRSLQYMFIGLAIMPMCLVIAAGSLSFSFKNEMMDTIEEEMQESIAESYENLDVMEAWDTLQDMFSCCGVSESQDWIDFCDIKTTEATPMRMELDEDHNRKLPETPKKIEESLPKSEDDTIQAEEKHSITHTERTSIEDELNDSLKSTKENEKSVTKSDEATVDASLNHNVTIPTVSTTSIPDSLKKRSVTVFQCQVPQSCCKEKKCSTHNEDSIYEEGCIDVLKLNIMFISMGATGITVGVFMLFAIFVSFKLARKLEDN